jgi:hypothetical protein
MGRSEEFNRDGDADARKVVTKSGPLGYLPILYLVMSLIFIIVVLFLWWRT